MNKQLSTTAVRHRFADRAFHWVMAISVIILGVSAFLPIIGVKFDWIPWHWITGVVLTLAILFHLYRVLAVHGLREMMPGTDDVRELGRLARGRDCSDLRPAKYDTLQKGMHWSVGVTILALAATGLVMLAKIDTPFWNRDPSLLTDATWGVIYVIHGFASMAILFLVLVHIYFGLIPEHRAYLKAMLHGEGPQLARKGQDQ